MPTKQGGLRGSLRNVSTGVSAIPDSEDLHSNHDVLSITANDQDAITFLPDETGNGFGLGDDGSNASTYDADLINGNPGLDMPSGSRLNETSTNLSQPVTFFFVGAVTSTGAGSDQLIAGGAASSGTAGYLGEKNGSFRLYGGDFQNITSSDTGLHIFSFLFDGSNSVLRIDGNSFTGFDSGPNNIEDLGLNGLVGGGNSPGVFAGQLLTYNSDKSTIFTNVENYLYDRWDFSY